MDFDFDYRPGENLPLAAHARLRAAGPVVWAGNLNGWLVSSYEGVRQVLGDLDHFTSAGTPIAESGGAEAMLINDTPMHHTLRGVWTKSVSRASMQARMGELEANAAQGLMAVKPRLQAGETVQFQPVFQDFVMGFIASSFGVSRDRLDVFQRWSQMSADTPALALADGSPEHQRHFAAREEVFDLLRGEVADRKARFARGEEPTDLVSLMVAAEGRDGITSSMVLDNLFNFILGSMDTTEKWLGNVIVRLCTDPALRAEVAADRSLIEPVIDEVMRCDTVAQLIQRRVREGGAMLAGQQLREGDVIYVMLGVANRDPDEFSDADSFDFRRTVKPNLGFGFGFHHCLGLNVARTEVITFIGQLLTLLPPLRVVDADMGKSWALWGPRGLELSLA